MTGREVMDNLSRAITAVAEYRNNNETIKNNKELKQEAYKQTQRLRDARNELEKIFGLRRVSVKVGTLTLAQVQKICKKQKDCTGSTTEEPCPLFYSDVEGIYYCDANVSTKSFDENKVVYVLEEDLK